MATISSFYAQCKAREADYRTGPFTKFRWSRFRYEWGYRCYVIHPVEGHLDKCWWEWENG